MFNGISNFGHESPGRVGLLLWIAFGRIPRASRRGSNFFQQLVQVTDFKKTVTIDGVSVHRDFSVTPPVSKRVGRAAKIFSSFLNRQIVFKRCHQALHVKMPEHKPYQRLKCSASRGDAMNYFVLDIDSLKSKRLNKPI